MVSFVSTIRVGLTRGFTGLNAGVSGQKARDIANRIDQVLALDFNLIVAAGTNDRPLGSHPGCTRGSLTTAMSSWPWVNTSAHVAQPFPTTGYAVRWHRDSAGRGKSRAGRPLLPWIGDVTAMFRSGASAYQCN
ncbi:MAG: hypothetical protein ACREEJ_26535 [Ensifer adhaerens]